MRQKFEHRYIGFDRSRNGVERHLQRRKRLLAKIVQAIAEQQHLTRCAVGHVSTEIGGTVVGRCLQRFSQGAPVAASDHESLRRFSDVANTRETNFAVTHFSEVRIEQCKLTRMVACGTAAGAIPDEADQIRNCTCRFNGHQRNIGVKIIFTLKNLRRDLRRATGGNIDFDHTAPGEIISRSVGMKSIETAIEREHAERI